MAFNARNNHNFVFAEGGTGIRVLLALYQMLSSRAYAEKGATTEDWEFLYETLDAGAEELGELLKLLKNDENLKFYNPEYSFTFLKLAERVKEKLNADQTLCLEEMASDRVKDGLLLPEEELYRDYHGGCYRNQVLGSFISLTAIKCALGTEEDKRAGFQAVINAVLASNNAYETRVVLIGSGIGGEGRNNICKHPAILKKLCIEKAMENLNMQYEQAKAYVERNLKIAVIMTGSPFRFPEMKKLNQDNAGMVAGTLRNFPDDSAEAVNLFYLLEHDYCPVQADTPSDSGEQHKHAHAMELVAAAAVENFFNRDTEEASKKQCPVFPNYSLPGRGVTNWENLALPERYRTDLSARLRFDAALFYWIRPQLILSSDERGAGRLYESEILSKMFNTNGKPKKLEKMIQESGFDVDQEIVRPLKALLEKESAFLKYLREVCLTGKNWETGTMPPPQFSTNLFDGSKIDQILNCTDINTLGGMKGFCFDTLTECSEDNLYHTNLTMDDVIWGITYREAGKPKSFYAILSEVYDMCSNRKGNRHGIFKRF